MFPPHLGTRLGMTKLSNLCTHVDILNLPIFAVYSSSLTLSSVNFPLFQLPLILVNIDKVMVDKVVCKIYTLVLHA